jgi:hypothetical protein
MHPTKQELELYADGLMDDPGRREDIQAHMETCEFCREYLENYDLMRKSLDEMSEQELPAKALALADRLYRQAFAGQVIALEILAAEKIDQPFLMAADGEEKFTPDTVSLATYYSEEPELVLKIMRDNRRNQEYLQLIGDSPQAGANMLVQILDSDIEFVTDSEGKARVAHLDMRKIEEFKWQVKMPDAVFDLEPLQYDPEKIEYSKEITLETEKNDKIMVAFEGKTEGKQISIRILELEGKSDFERVRVGISQEGRAIIKSVDKDGRISFVLDDLSSPINIRLYT